ncbi:MAG: hypothetical protein ACREA0_17965, partial [bacterium]
AMLSERRRVQAAREAYSGYLELEPRGIFSDAARDYLGDGSERHAEGLPNKRSRPKPPVDLGRLSRANLQSRFPDARLADFSVGSFSGAFIHFSGGQALAIADTIGRCPSPC